MSKFPGGGSPVCPECGERDTIQERVTGTVVSDVVSVSEEGTYIAEVNADETQSESSAKTDAQLQCMACGKDVGQHDIAKATFP